ncbi:hypothetical protein [Aromatoleum diolicum]|uniref:Uncharacterized protein n=1 Tax=Aromatoleum diolicum TaxID=75796 RepID=A0ABX1Q4U7_9RHOO|nr:hypothetical protein [Aromatoleum diolicum]NMG73388.1 hypothetical protein [Aromatoleum diolicum]
MKRTSWITAPLCATAALFIALHGTTVGAADSDDLTAEGVKLRGDGSVDDSQPMGAAPVQTVETVTNPDGTTTVTRVRTLSATGAAPTRNRSMEMTFGTDGGLLEQSRTDIRTNADGVVVRERSSSLELIDGVPVRTRSDIRRNDAGEVIRSLERVKTVDRPASSSIERAERIEKRERPEKLERIEKVERLERIERPEKVERLEKIERRERG